MTEPAVTCEQGHGLVTVVQHAEKERSAGDPGLTERGHEQARRIARRLAGSDVDVLLCSPLRRTRETAAPLAKALGLEPVPEARLVERMNWDGSVPLEEFLADWDRATQDRGFVPRVGESSSAAGERFASVVREVGRRRRHAVLVAHGGVTVDGLRTLVGDAKVGHLFPGWRDGVRSGGLSRLLVADGAVRLLGIGDTSHLDG